MRKAGLTAAIGLAAAVSGCGVSHGEEAGPAGSRVFPVAGFQKIEVAGPYDLEVRSGPGVAVSAQGPEDLLERLEVEVRNGVLEVRPRREKGGWFRFGGNHGGKVLVRVTVPSLSGASLAGAGDIRIDRVRGESFEGDLAGSGGLAIGQIEVGRLAISIAGAGDVRVQGGTARTIDYEIAGSGDIDTRAVRGEQLAVSIAGAGNVKAYATGSADVDIMGSGDVEISGGAKCRVSKMGSGNVRCT